MKATAVKRYCDAVYAMKPIYLWGANMEVLTEKLLLKLKQRFGEEHYKKINMSIHEGLYGADCNGLAAPISPSDMTAAGYYTSCTEKGPATKTPQDLTCFLFREEVGKVVHMAIYTGDGLLYEMWEGCRKREFVPSEWSYYGIPDWIEQDAGPKMVHLGKATKVYRSAQDAINGKGYVAIYPAGDYYLYKTYKTASNITKTEGVPGGWCVI